MSNQNVNSSETVYVLNDKYQYDADAVSKNAKWLDTTNVVSVKRDKTIYAVRATNDYDFNGNTNQEFFANIGGRSNLYRNFGSNTAQSILMVNPAPVYGDIDNGQVGLAGSLSYEFSYLNDAEINVSSYVNVSANPIVAALPSNIQINFDGAKTSASGYGNVDGNTCGKVLKLTTDDNAPVWNRLINANINGTVLVNCSTDPCDLIGNPIPSVPSSANAGTAVSNEAYREQIAVKSDPATTNLSINNPVYIARVSPFGTNLTGTSGVAENIKIHSFTGNFFANLPADNVLYANGNIMTSLSISGNINNYELSLFNSNVLETDKPLNGINLQNVPSTLDDLNNIVSVTLNTNASRLDTLANSGEIVDFKGNLNNSGTFKSNDTVMITQGNVSISPLYLMDRLSPSNTAGFVLASNVFSYSSGDTRTSVSGNINTTDNVAYYSISADLQSGTNQVESSAKYLYLTGSSIQKENWQIVSNVVAPVAVPTPTGIPNQSNYVTGNVIDVYVQKGSIGVSNYTPYANKENSGVWVKSIPSFMNTFSEPSGNAYLDTAVFGNVASASKNINIGNVSNPINVSASVLDNYNFYFFGNTSADSRTDNRVGNVVANTNSVIADAWSYNANGARNNSSIQWYPMIAYGDVVPSDDANVVRPLSLSNSFANSNVDYKLEFPSYVGKTTAPSSGPYSFFANIGTDGLIGNAEAKSLNQFNLTNNSAINDILLNDVVSTTFTVKSNSYKYTDIGTVVIQNATNSEFNAVLPFAGNINSSANGTNGTVLADVAMNVITDYFQNPALLTGDSNNVHRLTIHDIQYRYAITGVTRSGTSPLSTKLTINNSTDLAASLMTKNGNIVNSQVNGNLAAPEFTLFTYDNVSQYTPSDALYPFLAAESANISEQDRWFPGFNYRQNSFYSSKTDAEVDFTIETNTQVEQNVSFLFQAINANGNTVSVAKSTDNAFKSIPIRKIRFGSSNGVHPYYGYIVVKVLGESSSYVVILYKLNSDGNNYDSNISVALPVVVNVKSIELSAVDSKQQVEFKSTLRVYAPNDTLVQSFSNVVNSHKSPLSLFNYSSAYGSNDCSVGVNTYAAPPSNAIMQWAYKQSVIKSLVTYEYSNNVLNGMSGYKAANAQISNKALFAITQLNNTTSAIPDINNSNLALIPALSYRCYLDAGYGNGVYIDIANTYVLAQPVVFSVDRSVEWVLKRKLSSSNSYEVVGRGLLSHARNENSSYEKRDYLILENDLTKATSGFQMSVNTNVVDLSTRLLAQSISKGSLKNGDLNELALNLRTVPDNLSMVIYKVNPATGNEATEQFAGPYVFSAASSNVDLASLMMSNNAAYKGQLPSFNLSAIRGYQIGEVNVRTNALFSVNYTRDNYAIIQLFQNTNKTLILGGRCENNSSNVAFAQSNQKPNVLNCSLLGVVFNNVANKGTLNRDFATLNNAAGNFVKYVSYIHNGFGSMSYRISEFTSNYGKTLPTQKITSGSQTPVFEFSSNDAYKVATPVETSVTVNILYDILASKYYAPITSFNRTTNLYFRGTGIDSLPTQFNGKNTVLLYTGTRPIVISTLVMREGARLVDISSAANVSDGMFNNRTWLQYSSANIIEQEYSVLFTNSVQAAIFGKTTVGSMIISPRPSYFSNAGDFYLGSFINSAGILNNNFVNIGYTKSSRRYPFTVFAGQDSVNPVQSDEVVTSANGADKKLYDTFICKNPELGELFKITIVKAMNAQPYNITINPATVQIYEAIDANDNGEIDVSSNTTNPSAFGLEAAFSELLYTLTPNNSKLTVPKVIDSWVLDREFHNIKGSALSINMNVKWNVGYNLGNFFTIRENNVAKFEVITIHTEYNSSANNNNMTSLVVSPTTSLIVGNKESWAHAPRNGALSGLAFKLNKNKIGAGDTVRLFVDNQVSANNTVSLAVGNKTYKLSSYDQAQYAVLLDEQIRFTNKLE